VYIVVSVPAGGAAFSPAIGSHAENPFSSSHSYNHKGATFTPGWTYMKKKSITVRNATLADVPGIVEVAAKAYARWSTEQLATERNYEMQISAFPEGQFVAVKDDKIIGYCSSLIVYLLDDSPWYAHGEITGFGSFSTHDPSGNTLYGSDIAVDPDYQRQGVSKKLYAARKSLLKRHNLKQMIAGGRIPGYSEYRGKMSADEYVARVVKGELHDKALNAHIRAGYEVRGVHYGYIDDEQSLGYSTHLVMPNPRHRATKRVLAGQPIKRTMRRARVCAVQYEMRRIRSWEELGEQVEYFVDTADLYDSHLVVFPELFIAQMLCTLDRTRPLPELVTQLADMHGQYIELFTELATSRQMLIVAGSIPTHQQDGTIRNVAHLFSPMGNVYTQEKLHLTPAESTYWGLSRGEGLKVFDTHLGRIAILICYDIEFPELSRMLVDAGVDLIVVPFATDERKSYQRVRYCAQARAVENMIYVVLAGNVGALPRSPAMTLNFGQAAVLTPSDFAFPLNAIAAEGIINSQTVVISDIDLGALEVERQVANVRPLIDRRPDIYVIQNHIKIENCKVN
jgi:predicted amidohydrolase/ribosomal protein S18 acetylase RimI-like enzyme